MISQQGTHRVEEERAAPRQDGQLRGPSVPSDAHVAVLHPDTIPHVVCQNHPVTAPVHPDCSESSTTLQHTALQKQVVRERCEYSGGWGANPLQRQREERVTEARYLMEGPGIRLNGSRSQRLEF